VIQQLKRFYEYLKPTTEGEEAALRNKLKTAENYDSWKIIAEEIEQ
jgi:hypothetical protein